MKTLIGLAITLGASFVLAQVDGSYKTRPMVQTDVDAVLNGGSVEMPSSQIQLKPGLYFIGDGSFINGWSHFLLLDSFVNDPSKLVGLMISKDAVNDGNTSKIKILQARPLANGSVMLAPIVINSLGIPSVDSELTRDSQVMEISLNSSRPHNDHFVIEGHNGALGGKILQMKIATKKFPNWSGWPSAGIFESPTTQGKLVVRGGTVGIHDGRQMSVSYVISQLNSAQGKFAGLKRAKFDTMSEQYLTESKYSKFAFFLNGLCDEELFVIASPGYRAGEYVAEIYSPKKRNIFQILSDLFRSAN